MKKKANTFSLIVLFVMLAVSLSALAYSISSISNMRNEIVVLKSNLNTEKARLETSQGSNTVYSQVIHEKSIPIVAVSNDNVGLVGNLTLRLIPGSDNVLINTNPFLETDLQYSVNSAVDVAKQMAIDSNKNDFVYTYQAGDSKLIGGGSAGAATTILTIAAMNNYNLKNDAVITGTINPDGSIGEIAGLMEKAKAVADAGYKYFLIPKGQGVLTYYEKQVIQRPLRSGFTIYNTAYVEKTINVIDTAKKQWGLTVIEVSDINEALPYFIQNGESAGNLLGIKEA